MNIRYAEPADAREIMDVRVDAWRQAYINFLPEKYLDSLDPQDGVGKLADRLTDQNKEFFSMVWQQDETVQGFLFVGSPRFKCDVGVVELYALNVRPQYWGHGGASALLKRAIPEARDMNYQRMDLWVIDGNERACRVYERHGFTDSNQQRTSSGLTGHPITEVRYSLAMCEY